MKNTDNIPHNGRPGIFYGWYVVAASWVMIFLATSVAMNIFFKPILEEFGLDRATLSLVQTVAMLVFAGLSPFLGQLIDRFGPRTMIFFCIIAQTLSSLVTGLAGSLWHLYLGRFFFEMKPMHSTQVLINRWFVKKRGQALGIVATGMPIGALVLSPVSQYMVLTWGWRETMLFWSGVNFVIMFVLGLLIRNNPQDKGYGPDGEPLDTPAFYTDSIPETAPRKEAASESGNSLAEALKARSFWLLSAATLICGIGCGFMMTHTIIFATDMGYSEMIGATLLSVQGGVNLVGVLFTGHLSDRITRSKVLALTHFIRSLSFFTVVIFVFLGGGSLWLLYMAMALFGFGWFTTAPLCSGIVADLFGYRRMGTLIGMNLSFHMVGMAIGSYAGGITFELTGSYNLLFVTQGILECMAAGFAFIINYKTVH